MLLHYSGHGRALPDLKGEKMSTDKKRRTNALLIAITLACVAIYLGLRNIDVISGVVARIMDVIMPLLVGFGIALILNVPMSFLERNLWCNTKKVFLIKSRRWVALLLSLVFIIGLLAGVVLLILPSLVEAVTVIVQSAVEIVEYINSMGTEEIEQLPFGELLLEIDWNRLLDSLKSWLSNQAHLLVDKVFGTLTSLVGSVIDLFVSVSFAFYLLFSKQKLKNQIHRLIKAWLPEKQGEWICHALSVGNRNFKSFIAGQSIEAIILGVLCFIGMIIFRFPYAAMVSAVVGITALVPVIGCYVGGGVGAFMILTVDPMLALWFVVYIIILQQIEGNLIYPKVVGDKVKLSPLWIIAAVTVGGSIGGPVGMLVGVPLTATLYQLLREATAEREGQMLAATPSGDAAASDAPSDNTAASDTTLSGINDNPKSQPTEQTEQAEQKGNAAPAPKRDKKPRKKDPKSKK